MKLVSDHSEAEIYQYKSFKGKWPNNALLLTRVALGSPAERAALGNKFYTPC